MNKTKILSFTGLLLVVLLWGIAPVVSKYLFDNNFYSPALLVAVRGLLAVIAMFFFILFTGGFKDFSKKYWIALPAGIILGAAYLFQFIGLESTTPAKNTFLETLSCIAVPICMFIFVREKPTWMTLVSIVIVLIGAFILCGNGWDFTAMFTAPTTGDILSAIAGIFFGIDIAVTKVFAKDKNAWLFVFIQLIVLTIMSFIYALPFEKNLAFSWDWKNLLILVFLGVGCTAICWVLRTICIKNVSAVTCSVLMPMSAVIATFTSVICRVEEFSWNTVVGGVIITFAIIISGLYEAKVIDKEKNEENKEEKNEQDSCQ